MNSDSHELPGLPAGVALRDATASESQNLRYVVSHGGRPLRVIVIDRRALGAEDDALNVANEYVQRYSDSEFFLVVLLLKPHQ